MEPRQVVVEFVIDKQLAEGETLVVAGNISQLGNWTPSSALPMLEDCFSYGWTASVNLLAGLTFEYKIVQLSADKRCLTWMTGSNRQFVVPPFARMISIINSWDFVAGSTPLTITFGMMKPVDMNRRLLLSGDRQELEKWKLHRAHAMVWHVGDRWKVDVNVVAGATIEYKYVCASDQLKEVEWMPGPNRMLLVPKSIVALSVLDLWSIDPVPISHTSLLPQVQITAVYFVLVHRCSFGQLFKVVGNIDKLGKWNPHAGLKMVWHFDDVWIGAINLFAGTSLEYKILLVRESDNAVVGWQAGLNRRLLIPNIDHEFIVKEVWL